MAKVMVSLPDDVLERVDAEARRELERRDPGAVQAAIARSRERFHTAGAFESADLVRADRDALS